MVVMCGNTAVRPRLTHCRRGEILMAFYSTGEAVMRVTGDKEPLG